MVEEVLDQWYGPQDAFYKVRADDGNFYILRRETSTPEGTWHLVSFRQLPRENRSVASFKCRQVCRRASVVRF
jgi:hypothetical protein